MRRCGAAIGAVLAGKNGSPRELILPVIAEVTRGTLLSAAPPGSAPTRGKAGSIPVGALVIPLSLGINNPPPAPGVDEGPAPGPGTVAFETASCTILSIDEDMAVILAAMALLIIVCRGVARTVLPPPVVGDVIAVVAGVTTDAVVPVADVTEGGSILATNFTL